MSPALINRCKVISNLGFIKQVCSELPKDLCLISPDSGALKKIYKLAQQLEHYPVIEASKLVTYVQERSQDSRYTPMIWQEKTACLSTIYVMAEEPFRISPGIEGQKCRKTIPRNQPWHLQ